MRILVMSEHYQGALACIQSFGRAGHEVLVLAGAHRSVHVASRYVAEAIAPAASENTIEAKARAILALVRARNIDLVVPISDEDARIVARAHATAPDVRAFVASSEASVAIASDKIATLELAETLGVAVPRSIVANDRSEVASAAAPLGLPVVAKVPVSTASDGTFVARSIGELKRIAEKLPPGRILLQRFIEGDRVDACGFARDGQLVEWFGFRHMFREISAGTPAYAFSDMDSRLGDALAAICRKLAWNGGIDLDLMRDANGRSYLLEINPRFSGTMILADKLGLDLPRHYADAAAGRPPATAGRPIPSDVLFISVVPNEVGLISSDPAKWQKWTADLRKAHTFVDNLYLDDGPLLAAQMQLALHMAWNAKRPGR